MRPIGFLHLCGEGPCNEDDEIGLKNKTSQARHHIWSIL